MSTKTMTITDIAKSPKSFKDTHTLSVGGFKDGDNGRITLKGLDSKITDLSNKLDSFIAEQREFNKLIMSRIDNLVSKNNLKE